MAIKRNCEHKNYLTKKGSSLRFIGAARDVYKNNLMHSFCFALHVCEVGDDIVAYYQEDWYKDELRFMRENYAKYLGNLLSNKRIVKSTNVLLAKVLPERLPRQYNKTWQQVYEEGLESTERDENGMKYTSRKVGANYNKSGDDSGEEEPAVVRTYSISEFRANGHF